MVRACRCEPCVMRTFTQTAITEADVRWLCKRLGFKRAHIKQDLAPRADRYGITDVFYAILHVGGVSNWCGTWTSLLTTIADSALLGSLSITHSNLAKSTAVKVEFSGKTWQVSNACDGQGTPASTDLDALQQILALSQCARLPCAKRAKRLTPVRAAKIEKLFSSW